LAANGYEVVLAGTGAEALRRAHEQPDVVLLDLGLPDLDGIEVCRQLHGHSPELPILVLTARTAEVDVVVGLDAGAVDYITKPFRLAELLARLRAQLRRPGASADGLIRVGDLSIDPAARRVWVGGQEVVLRAKEFDVLSLLAREAGKVVTRERLMTEVWDEHWFGSTKTLDVHIASVRRQLGERPGAPSRITTMRMVGYRLELP
jgi:DNA-binding response OmpR family regulator